MTIKQILFHWGVLSMPAYGLCVGLAFLIGMALAEARGLRVGFRQYLLLDGTAIGVVGAIIGMRVFDFRFEAGAPAVGQGLSFFGGLMGAVLAGLVYLGVRRVPVLRALDCVFLYVPLCHAIGRLGCWFYGCCHGKVCPEWLLLGVCFPRHDDQTGHLVGSVALMQHIRAGILDPRAQWSLPVYPTQLFASSSLVTVFVVLRLMADRSWAASKPGTIVFAYCICGFRKF